MVHCDNRVVNFHVQILSLCFHLLHSHQHHLFQQETISSHHYFNIHSYFHPSPSPFPSITTSIHHHFHPSTLSSITTSIHHHFHPSPFPPITHHHFHQSSLPSITTPSIATSIHHHFHPSTLPSITTFHPSPITTSIHQHFHPSTLPSITTPPITASTLLPSTCNHTLSCIHSASQIILTFYFIHLTLLSISSVSSTPFFILHPSFNHPYLCFTISLSLRFTVMTLKVLSCLFWAPTTPVETKEKCVCGGVCGCGWVSG